MIELFSAAAGPFHCDALDVSTVKIKDFFTRRYELRASGSGFTTASAGFNPTNIYIGLQLVSISPTECWTNTSMWNRIIIRLCIEAQSHIHSGESFPGGVCDPLLTTRPPVGSVGPVSSATSKTTRVFMLTLACVRSGLGVSTGCLQLS